MNSVPKKSESSASSRSPRTDAGTSTSKCYCLVIIVYFFLALSLLDSGCSRSSTENHRVYVDGILVPHLYAYSPKDVSGFIEVHGSGGKDLPSRVSRNGDGSKLYLYWSHGREVMMISQHEAKTLKAPALVSYLDDQGRWVYMTEDLQDKIRITNQDIVLPKVKKGITGHTGMDPSGRYFFYQPHPNRTEVRMVKDPITTVLVSQYDVEWIFLKSDRIFLLGRTVDSSDKLNLQVQKQVGGRWIIEKETVIDRGRASPTPFTVEDLDPFSNNILLRDTRDMRQDQWFLYETDTSRLRFLGKASYWGVFLKDDFLSIN